MNTPLLKLCFIGLCLALLSTLVKSDNPSDTLTLATEGIFINGISEEQRGMLPED